MSDTTTPLRFELDPPSHVLVHHGTRVARTSVPAARRLFLASATAPPGNHPLVVLSVCGIDTGRYVCVTNDNDTPPWPEFLQNTPDAVPHPLPLQTWVTVPPGSGDPQPLLDAARRGAAAQDVRRSQEIDERCKKILEDGTCDDFTQSLDYYTTLQVKRAFQSMNRTGLQTRLAEVRQRIRELEDWCKTCLTIATINGWHRLVMDQAREMTTATVVGGAADPAPQDPQSICVPCFEDFSLPFHPTDDQHDDAPVAPDPCPDYSAM